MAQGPPVRKTNDEQTEGTHIHRQHQLPAYNFFGRTLKNRHPSCAASLHHAANSRDKNMLVLTLAQLQYKLLLHALLLSTSMLCVHKL